MTAARRALLIVVVLLGTAISGGMATAQNAAVATSTACGLSQRLNQQASGGVSVISRPNPFNDSGQRLCITGTGRPGFKVLDNLRYTGAWQAYPFTGAGCAYNLCTRGTDMPRQVRKLPGNANSSFTWHGSQAPGSWNASYDIWFDKDNQTTAQDDGAELMIWLRPNPGYHGGVRVHIAKRTYWFMTWRTCSRTRVRQASPLAAAVPPRAGPGDSAGICWNYVQFRFLSVVHGVQRLWLMPFIRFLEGQDHLVRGSWWLTSVHAGYELVSGGKGLHTTWFNVHI
jgi:Glycosyl hydrolase family 12